MLLPDGAVVVVVDDDDENVVDNFFIFERRFQMKNTIRPIISVSKAPPKIEAIIAPISS